MDRTEHLTRRQFVAAASALPLLPLTGSTLASATAVAPLRIQRLAWAGVRLELGDVALFIDAITPDAPSGLPGPALETAAKRRFALVTHPHGDHCSLAALKPVLGDNGYLVAHEDSVRFIDSRIVPIEPTRLHEPNLLSRGNGEFVAWCVPASDGLGSPQVAWVVDGGGKRIIHCGDTAWHGGFWSIARVYGPFDAAFLPINGFRQSGGLFTSVEQPMSLTPEQAALVAQTLGARLTVPIHYGNTGEPSYVEESQAVSRFTAAMKQRSLRMKVLDPGASIEI
jgi:L-ascorbate metabolism protein UlaG (beta-lactamase superfamily)